MAAARFEEAHRVLLSLGPGLTEGRSKRDLQRTMSQLLSLVSDGPPALLSDATLDLLGRVTAAAVSQAARAHGSLANGSAYRQAAPMPVWQPP